MATLIKTDGTQQEVHPANGKRFTLEELQGFVGGLIEMIDLDFEGIMWINEEGKLEDLPFNELATQMASPFLFWGDYVAGDVVVLTVAEDRKSREGDEDEDMPLAA